MDIPRKLHVSDAVARGLYRLRVMLDGEKINKCIRYDMDAGEVECFVVDKNNRLVIENDEPKTKVLHGVVTVERT